MFTLCQPDSGPTDNCTSFQAIRETNWAYNGKVGGGIFSTGKKSRAYLSISSPIFLLFFLSTFHFSFIFSNAPLKCHENQNLWKWNQNEIRSTWLSTDSKTKELYGFLLLLLSFSHTEVYAEHFKSDAGASIK